jgi:hypothetical protein
MTMTHDFVSAHNRRILLGIAAYKAGLPLEPSDRGLHGTTGKDKERAP